MTNHPLDEPARSGQDGGGQDPIDRGSDGPRSAFFDADREMRPWGRTVQAKAPGRELFPNVS